MDFLILILVVAGTFGLCVLVDKGFTRTFRGAPQHKSGMSVRLSKHFGGGGIALMVLGVLGLMAGQGWLLAAAGGILILTGGALVVYYMTFGVYYDEEGFVLATLGRPSGTYRFSDIQAQQLYLSGGKTIIELYLADGRAVQLQSTMTGVYPFLDKAFSAWCRQKGISREDCAFHDPMNSCWFPSVEE